MAGRSLKHLPNPAGSTTKPTSWCGRLEDPLLQESGIIDAANVNCGFCYKLKVAADAAAQTTT